MKNPQKITLCGYYGRGNLGDEAILQAILHQIKINSPRAQVQVLNTKNPLAAAQKMLKADLFIFGGGSILQNATSNASLAYYLATIRLASLLCNRKIMLSNGIGPIIPRKISKKILIRTLSQTINRFDFISVRDTKSQKFLQKLLPNRKIHFVPDPALIEFQKLNQELTSRVSPTPKTPFFVFCPHANSLKKGKISPQQLAQTLASIANFHHLTPEIVIFNEKEDLALAKSLKKHLKNTEIITPHTPAEAAQALFGAKFVISGRYHASLLAISQGLPTLSISADPKITALAEDFNTFPAPPPKILSDSTYLNAQILKMTHHHNQNKENTAQKINLSATQTTTAFKKILD